MRIRTRTERSRRHAALSPTAPYLKYKEGKHVYARTVFTNVAGERVTRALGRYGSPESYALHREIVDRWTAEQKALVEHLERGPVVIGPRGKE